jgi:hypothetical protein
MLWERVSGSQSAEYLQFPKGSLFSLLPEVQPYKSPLPPKFAPPQPHDTRVGLMIAQFQMLPAPSYTLICSSSVRQQNGFHQHSGVSGQLFARIPGGFKRKDRPENIVKPQLVYKTLRQANFASTAFFQPGHTEADMKSTMSVEPPLSITKTMERCLLSVASIPIQLLLDKE